MRFDGKIAVVTGAGSGFGEAIATRFAREGARVVVADVNEENGRRVVSAIAREGGAARFFRADLIDDLRRNHNGGNIDPIHVRLRGGRARDIRVGNDSVVDQDIDDAGCTVQTRAGASPVKSGAPALDDRTGAARERLAVTASAWMEASSITRRGLALATRSSNRR